MRTKTVLKKATEAPFKTLLKRAGSKAAVGAAGGSIVPGMGTGIGALSGILVGIITSVAVDGALLKFEEVLNRADFRSEIIVAIREARNEFKEEYFGLENSARAVSPK